MPQVNSTRSDFPNLTSVDLLKIEASSAPLGSAGGGIEIFQNGRHQIEVLVRMSAKQKTAEGAASYIFPENLDLRKHFYLCYYDTGAEIDYVEPQNDQFPQYLVGPGHYGESSFVSDTARNQLPQNVCYSLTKTQYCHNNGEGAHKNTHDSSVLVRFYVTVNGSSHLSPFKIACGFKYHNGKDDVRIDTTETGTKQKMSIEGTTFRQPSYITVVPQTAIDYSDEANLKIVGKWVDYQDLASISKSLRRYHESDIHLGHRHNDGECYRGKLTISPSDPTKIGLGFLSCYRSHIDSLYPSVSSTMPSYNGKNIAGYGADIFYSHSTNSGYGAAFVFVQKTTYGLENDFAIRYEDAWGIRDECILHINDAPWGSNSESTAFSWTEALPADGSVCVNYCNYWVLSSASENKAGWSNHNEGASGGVRCHVIDNYGNTGNFLIQGFPADGCRLRLNGHLI